MVIDNNGNAEHKINRICGKGRKQTEKKIMSLLVNITKRKLKLLGHIKRKEGLEDLIFTGQIEERKDRGKQCINRPSEHE